MLTLFALHVLFFSAFATGLTTLPKPLRAVGFYAYLSIILIIGGFLGNAYSLPISGEIVVSGGNLAYGAFMMTSIIFILAERDSFILRRLIQLVIVVDIFNILLSLLITRTFAEPGTLNPHGTPSALFETSIPFIILGGILIIFELGIMLFIFELIKRFTLSPVLVRVAYFFTFVAILCFDGIAFPLIAFGPSPEVIAVVAGGLSGKLLTAASYSLSILAFTAIFPAPFAAYLNERVFTWRTLLSTSSAIIRDLEDKDAQLAKTQSQTVHSAVLAGLGHAIFNRKTGRVVECDQIYAGMHGLTVEEFISLDIESEIIGNLIHEDDRQKNVDLQSRIFKGEVVISELRHVLPSGEIRSLRKIFSPLNPSDPENEFYEVVGQDVTETRQLQDKLFQSQKMDAIGKLTGGVAHDFNNLLAVTLGNLEHLNDEVTDPDLKKLIQNSIDATLRGADLTGNMLSFARKAPLKPTIVDLNQLVQEMEKWIGRTLPSTIEVETELPAGLWPCKVDPTSAESGLLNLILNARDAMPQGGKLTLVTSNVTVDENCVELRNENVEPGRYVLLSVTDTGEGIPSKNLKTIFEPFFTTKPVGSGSGLGLSMVEGFMRQTGGTILVSSEPNVGTTFKLYFPAATTTQTKVRATSDKISDRDSGKLSTILVVEDNAEVLNTFRMTLMKYGYRVLAATSGDEAYKTFQEEPDIDLLLTDIVMPGDLQGATLAKALRELRPYLPVVFMSGHASEETVHESEVRPQDIRLVKPIRREDLLRAVNEGLSLSGKTQA